jgi:hypothetical protein
VLSRTARIGGIALVLALAGCGGVKPAPPGASPPAAAQAEPAKAAPAAPSVTPASPPPPSPPPPAVAAQAPTAAIPPTAPAAPAPAAKSAAKAEAPAAKVAAKAPAATAPSTPPPKKDVAQEPAKPKEAPLDLTSLETRLKETKAIGLMTKIALKNQVDDLLNQFRAFYAGKLQTTLADLRRPYDLLVLKVLSLLQDSDPTLASAIVASREAIWGILSDKAKFANFASN